MRTCQSATMVHGYEYRCFLEVGHAGNHRTAGAAWKNHQDPEAWALVEGAPAFLQTVKEQ